MLAAKLAFNRRCVRLLAAVPMSMSTLMTPLATRARDSEDCESLKASSGRAAAEPACAGGCTKGTMSLRSGTTELTTVRRTAQRSCWRDAEELWVSRAWGGRSGEMGQLEWQRSACGPTDLPPLFPLSLSASRASHPPSSPHGGYECLSTSWGYHGSQPFPAQLFGDLRLGRTQESEF
ncbi:hypothetical protein C8R47DRAFT_109734 [Mycena vitilis]|nr:hypothetical protein C8R47DRAFT_109734 [Mycena vitilis]